MPGLGQELEALGNSFAMACLALWGLWRHQQLKQDSEGLGSVGSRTFSCYIMVFLTFRFL